MTDIVLIHGAWHDGGCWDATARALRDRGWRVACPDVTGDRLAACAAMVPWAPVMLGHSMGGMLAEATAQARPPRRLIHLCSYLPLPGDSAARLDRLLPGPARGWPRDAQGRLILSPDAARAMLVNGAGTPLPRLHPQPTGPMRDPLPGPARAACLRDYVVCGADRAIPPALQRAMLARAGVDRVHDRGWDHAPYLSDPAGLAALLDRILRA